MDDHHPAGLAAVRAIMSDPSEVDLPDELRGALPEADWQQNAPPPAPPGGPDRDGDENPPERRCAGLPLNDRGNGERIVTHYGNDILFVAQVGWFVWDGRRWRRDEEISRESAPRVRRLVHGLGDMIAKEVRFLATAPRVRRLLDQERQLLARQRELDAMADSTAADAAEMNGLLSDLAQVQRNLKDHKGLVGQRLTFAKNAGNSNAMNNALNEARVMLSHDVSQMDNGRVLMNCENGVIHMRDARPGPDGFAVKEAYLTEHRREDLLTKMMPVAYDPAARCERFDAFLKRIQPDIRMRLFLRQWFGLSLTALPVQQLAFFYGAGANGKSVLVDLISRIAGDYATTARIESLTGTNRKGGSDATPDLIPLIGARMVRTSEPEEGQRLQEGLVKAMTGGEPMMVRALHADFITFEPYFKLTISGNHKPDIRGTDDGIWRRVLLVPFDVQIPVAERIPKDELDAILWEERSGILNWLLGGLADYLVNGLAIPDSVLAATEDYRRDSDPIGSFLTEVTHVTGAASDFVTARELVDAFNFWVEERGETAWGRRTVSNRLKEKASRWRHPTSGRSYEPGKVGVTGYRGIRLDDAFASRQREAAAEKARSTWPRT